MGTLYKAKCDSVNVHLQIKIWELYSEALFFIPSIENIARLLKGVINYFPTKTLNQI